MALPQNLSSVRALVPILFMSTLIVLAGCTGAINDPALGANSTPLAANTTGVATPAPQTTTSAASTQTESSAATTFSSTPRSDTTAAGTLEVHQINVGQSAATLVIGPTGETMLIDSGDFRDDGEQVLAYLKAHNISRIDYLVTSHADADHIGGHAAIINYYEQQANGIGAVYDPGYPSNTQTYQEYLNAIEQYNVTLYETRAGDTIPMEGATVRVLGPPEQTLANGERNENSIVLKITHGQSDFLFTGDAESEEEEYLVETYGQQLRSTVLKAGHHGSTGSTSDALLNATRPKAVVISSAYDSPYGHPTEATLQRLANRSLPAYWTAVHGSTVFTSNGSAVTVSTQRAATTDPLALRTEPPIAPGTRDPVEQRAVYEAEDNPSSPPSTATQTPTETDTPAETPTRTRTQTPVATDGGTTTAPGASGLQVAEVQADAPGDDRENLNGEYVVLENAGSEPLDLSGWTLRDAADHAYTFPDGFTLAPGTRVTVHTGSGSDTTLDLYWDSGSAIWNNGGDTVTVTDADGTVVIEEEY